LVSGELVSDDALTFDKMSQAINSSHDLVRELVTKKSPPNRRVIVPLLVVPAGRLWQVEYRWDGAILNGPRQVKEATLFLNHALLVQGPVGGPVTYRLSHLQIFTEDALPGIADWGLQWGGGFFP
jgi:hypothetical protein